GGVIVYNRSKSSLEVEVKGKPDSDLILLQLKGAFHQQKIEAFSQGGDGVLRYQGRLCVPKVGELRQQILTKAHNSGYLFIQVPLRCTVIYGKSFGGTKCVGDPTSIVPLESVALKYSLTYEEVPVEILDRQVHRLRNKKVASVKVLWRSQSVEGATWEAEAPMMARPTRAKCYGNKSQYKGQGSRAEAAPRLPKHCPTSRPPSRLMVTTTARGG
ncbi:hypothetical protein MTR67_043245, partial [Solanum verrucosum]